MRVLWLSGCLLLSSQAFADTICGFVKSIQTNRRFQMRLTPSMTQPVSHQASFILDQSELSLGRTNGAVDGQYHCFNGAQKTLIEGELFSFKVEEVASQSEIYCGVVSKHSFKSTDWKPSYYLNRNVDGELVKNQVLPDTSIQFDLVLVDGSYYCLAADDYAVGNGRPSILMVRDIVSQEPLRCGNVDSFCVYQHKINMNEMRDCLDEYRFKLKGVKVADTLVCPEDTDYCSIAKAKCQKDGYESFKDCPEPVDMKCY